MAQFTEKNKFKKPDKTDYFNIDDFNENWQKAENALNEKVDKELGKSLSEENFTKTEKEKLKGIEENANKYIHPITHSADIIDTNPTKRFVTDAEKAIWNDSISEQRGNRLYALKNHNHNEIYYSKNETDIKLNSKSESTHNHDDRYYLKDELDDNFIKKISKSDEEFFIDPNTTTENLIYTIHINCPNSVDSFAIFSQYDNSAKKIVQIAINTKNENLYIRSFENKWNSWVEFLSKKNIRKEDLDMENVENYRIATKIESEEGVSNTKYMTPLRVLESIKANTKDISRSKIIEHGDLNNYIEPGYYIYRGKKDIDSLTLFSNNPNDFYSFNLIVLDGVQIIIGQEYSQQQYEENIYFRFFKKGISGIDFSVWENILNSTGKEQVKISDITIQPSDFKLSRENKGYLFRIEIMNKDVKRESSVDVNFRIEDINYVNDIGISSVTIAREGQVILYSEEKAKKAINATLVVHTDVRQKF